MFILYATPHVGQCTRKADIRTGAGCGTTCHCFVSTTFTMFTAVCRFRHILQMCPLYRPEHVLPPLQRAGIVYFHRKNDLNQTIIFMLVSQSSLCSHSILI